MASPLWIGIVSGAQPGVAVEITREPVTIGSGEGCALRVLALGVAPLHASVSRTDGGSAVLTSLVHEPSVTVNGLAVEHRSTLRAPADVGIGEAHLLVSERIVDFAAAARTEALLDEGMEAAEGPSDRRRRGLRWPAALATVALAVGAVAAVLALTGKEHDGGIDIARVARLASPGTVLVRAHIRARSADGSGWVLDIKRGLVVTNFHVVNGGRAFDVLSAGRWGRASVYAAAPCDDVAVLRVPHLRGHALAVGPGERPPAGAIVVALGFPANATGSPNLTLTVGVVSVPRARLPSGAPDSPSLPDVVQTDAALNPGDSGGPLLDRRGHVVGMNTAVLTNLAGTPVQGQGYAIGSARLRRVLGTLGRGRSLGWPGFSLSFPRGGVLVGDAPARTSAGRAGLAQRRMRLAAIAGRRVRPAMSSYCAAVSGRRGSAPVELRDLRTGAPRIVALEF